MDTKLDSSMPPTSKEPTKSFFTSTRNSESLIGASRGLNLARMVEIVRALLGLSRGIMAFFVLVHAGLAAVFALGELPPWNVAIIGVVASLTGAGALIGLNDILDTKIDRLRLEHLRQFKSFDAGSAFMRHPIAQGTIGHPLAISWVLSLSLISMIFTYLLNPWLPLLFITIAFFVTIYSLLNTISISKYLMVALAVTFGALAGWLAVAPPDWRVFPLFGLWSFLYEIGGRNIPNDFGDVSEDSKIGLKTIPVIYGPQKASQTTFILVILTFLTSIPVVILANLPLLFLLATALWGLVLLVLPAYQLLKKPEPRVALKLFNQACIYPVFLLISLIVFLYL